MANRSHKGEPVPPDRVRASLERILASEHFVHAQSQARLLRFLVERTLNGEGDSLKEYRLGVDVFGRGADFDPKNDTIVRVQARNLRSRLRSYYSATQEEVVIEIPKGSYVPVFLWREPAEEIVAPAWRRAAVPVAALGLLLCLLALWMLYFGGRGVRNRMQSASIAVLPFTDPLGSRDANLAQGLATEISRSLAQVFGLRIIAGNSVRRASEAKVPVGKLRDMLKVDQLLTGTVQSENSKLRVATWILALPQGAPRWSETYEMPLEKISSCAPTIVQAVLHQLGMEPKRPLAARGAGAGTDVYERYLRALGEKDRGQETRSLEDIVARYPNYPSAYSELALLYGSPSRAKPLAVRALELDRTQASARLTLARILGLYELAWKQAEAEFRQGLEEQPGSARGRYFYAVFLSQMNRLDEALAQVKRAQELDPLDAEMFALEGFLLTRKREYDRAIRLLEDTARMDPHNPYTYIYLAHAYADKGEFDRALAALERMPLVPNRPSLRLGHKGYIEAVSGNKAGAREMIQEIEKLPKERLETTCLAWVYIGLGEKEEAFEILQQAVTEDRFMAAGLKVFGAFEK